MILTLDMNIYKSLLKYSIQELTTVESVTTMSRSFLLCELLDAAADAAQLSGSAKQFNAPLVGSFSTSSLFAAQLRLPRSIHSLACQSTNISASGSHSYYALDICPD
jgi:hypothetical protein